MQSYKIERLHNLIGTSCFWQTAALSLRLNPHELKPVTRLTWQITITSVSHNTRSARKNTLSGWLTGNCVLTLRTEKNTQNTEDWKQTQTTHMKWSKVHLWFIYDTLLIAHDHDKVTLFLSVIRFNEISAFISQANIIYHAHRFVIMSHSERHNITIKWKKWLLIKSLSFIIDVNKISRGTDDWLSLLHEFFRSGLINSIKKKCPIIINELINRILTRKIKYITTVFFYLHSIIMNYAHIMLNMIIRTTYKKTSQTFDIAIL